MIYTAPRQGLFAIAIASSLCLHVVVFVISTEKQITNNRAQKGERLVKQLVDEASLAIAYDDKVSLSVLANRYTSEYDVTSLLIRDVNDVILTKIKDSLDAAEQGVVIKEHAIRNNTIIGEVELTMQATNKGEIFKRLWFFVFCFAVVHLLIWMVYGRIARPTKEQLKMLSKEIHEHYFAEYAQYDFEGRYAQRDTNNERLTTRPSQRSAIKPSTDAFTQADTLNKQFSRKPSQAKQGNNKKQNKNEGFQQPQHLRQNNASTQGNQPINPEIQNLHSSNNGKFQTDSTDIKPTEIKPTEVKPTEVKPTEVKPAEPNNTQNTVPISTFSNQNHQKNQPDLTNKPAKKQATSPIPSIMPNPLNTLLFKTKKNTSTNIDTETTSAEIKKEIVSINGSEKNVEDADSVVTSEDNVAQELLHFKKKTFVNDEVEKKPIEVEATEPEELILNPPKNILETVDTDTVVAKVNETNQSDNLKTQDFESELQQKFNNNVSTDINNRASARQQTNDSDKKWRVNYNNAINNINYTKFQNNIQYLQKNIKVNLSTFFGKLTGKFDSITKKITLKINAPSKSFFINDETNPKISDEINHDISGEINHEISGEINHEISGEINHEISGETNHEISDEINHEISDEINHEITDETTHKVNDETNQTDSLDTGFGLESDSEPNDTNTTINDDDINQKMATSQNLDLEPDILQVLEVESPDILPPLLQPTHKTSTQSFGYQEVEKEVPQNSIYPKPSYTMPHSEMEKEDEQDDEVEKVDKEIHEQEYETKAVIMSSKPVISTEGIRKSGAEPITSRSVFKQHNIKSELSAFISQNKASQKNIINPESFHFNKSHTDSICNDQETSSFFDAVKNHDNSTNGQSKKNSRNSILAPPSIAIDSEDKSDKKVKRSSINADISKELSALIEPIQTELSIESVQIQIQYIDKRRLINMLTVDKATEYFNSCNNVLNMACKELLSLPSMKNIKITNNPVFKDKGATIELQGGDKKQLSQAGLMLGILLQSTNEFFHEARREVKMFSLGMVFGINEPEKSAEIRTLLDNKAKANEVLLLLPESSINTLQKIATFNRIGKPKNSNEKACLFVSKLNISTMKIVDGLTESVFDQI